MLVKRIKVKGPNGLVAQLTAIVPATSAMIISARQLHNDVVQPAMHIAWGTFYESAAPFTRAATKEELASLKATSVVGHKAATASMISLNDAARTLKDLGAPESLVSSLLSHLRQTDTTHDQEAENGPSVDPGGRSEPSSELQGCLSYEETECYLGKECV